MERSFVVYFSENAICNSEVPVSHIYLNSFSKTEQNFLLVS